MTTILVDMRAKPGVLERLRALPRATVRAVEPTDEERELPAEILRDVEVLFCTIPPRNLGDMPALRLIQVASVGFTQLLGLGLVGRGIRACNGRGIYETAIAEWAVAMMVNLGRDLRTMIRNQEQCVWDRSARFQHELRGQTVGVWGYGGIGRETARLAKALGMTVHVRSRHGVGPRRNMYQVAGTGDPDGVLPDRVFTAGQERDFLGGLDYLVLAMPQTRGTTGAVGEAELRALPSRAFVLNPARGPLIQEAALLQALREGWIAGAALDTHYHYPMPPDHPLWRFPNVIMTPHISGSDHSPHFLDRVWDLFTQNVERYRAGEPLLNELTAAELNDE